MDLGVAEDQVEGPGEAGRGRLVAGEQQGHQLVAEVGVGEALAVLEAGEDQRGEDVVALLEVVPRAVLGDLGVEQVVDLAEPVLEAVPDVLAAAEAAQQQGAQLDPVRPGLGQEVAEQVAQALEPRPVGDAEHDPEDHLERDRLHVGMERELPPERPGVDLGVDDRGHHRLQRPHPLAVEGRQHQLPVREVVGAFEQEQRAGADDRLEEDVATGWKAVIRLAVEGLDRRRVGDHHHRPLEAEEGEAERVAEVAPAAIEEAEGPDRPGHGLPQRAHRRFWRKRHPESIAEAL